MRNVYLLLLFCEDGECILQYLYHKLCSSLDEEGFGEAPV